jgi:proteic killer suppression protein
VIRSFRGRLTRDVYDGVLSKDARRFPQELLPAARIRLDYLNYAASLNDLRSPPGNRLEALKGDLAGKHGIRINSQWRIIFRWTSEGPEDVEIVDYH